MIDIWEGGIEEGKGVVLWREKENVKCVTWYLHLRIMLVLEGIRVGLRFSKSWSSLRVCMCFNVSDAPSLNSSVMQEGSKAIAFPNGIFMARWRKAATHWITPRTFQWQTVNASFREHVCHAAEQAASTGGGTAPQDAQKLAGLLWHLWIFIGPQNPNWCMRNYYKLGVQDTATELPGCELGPRQAIEGWAL